MQQRRELLGVSSQLRGFTMSPSRHRRRAKPAWLGREIITVAALPGRGLYVRHLGHPEGVDGVHRPTVPPPGAPARALAQFDERWLGPAVSDMDIVHVHGLPRGSTRKSVERAVSLIRDRGLPLVVTAYHLSDPWGIGEDSYAEQFEPLVREADAVVTLTPSAAGELSRRFGVEAAVLPHPHVVDFVRMRRPRLPRRRQFLVGTHLGSLRSPGDPLRFVQALACAVRQTPDARLVVKVHDHLLDPGSARYAPDTLARISRAVEAVGGTVHTHRPMSDPQLWDDLFSLDAVVVPPVRGTHSIWPEACYDLGTKLLIPRAAPAATQRPCYPYCATVENVDPADLAAALARAHDADAGARADPEARWRERVQVAESLRGLYERLLPHKVQPRTLASQS